MLNFIFFGELFNCYFYGFNVFELIIYYFICVVILWMLKLVFLYLINCIFLRVYIWLKEYGLLLYLVFNIEIVLICYG